MPVWALTLLAACSGGGNDDPPPPPAAPTVTAVTLGTPQYGKPLLITLQGTGLDLLPTVTSTACPSPVRSTTAPNVSSATTAYYTCTVTATGASTVAVSYSGASLANQAYTVPDPQVTLTLSNGAGVAGDLVLTLDPTRVKTTVDNFLRYVADGYYTGTTFHRVLAGNLVQGGQLLPPAAAGATPQVKAGQRAPIPLQVNLGLNNTALTVAMVRPAGADSATAGFFINLIDNRVEHDPSATNPGFAVFGSLSAGNAVLNALASAPCAPLAGVSECLPDPSVVITQAAQTR